MRKHGWQLPYHPLQVVAIAVFLALAFAFYVFFVPFVGKKVFQYVVMGLYTPLVSCVFCLYVWCAAADPGDPGIFKSKKYLKVDDYQRHSQLKESKQGSSTKEVNETTKEKQLDGTNADTTNGDIHDRRNMSCYTPLMVILFGWFPWHITNCCQEQNQSLEQQSEEGMFYCSLCEVEVLKYSKHCRVCDKCVDGFDHHCRWLNNCIGRQNYKRFFVLMVSAVLLLILQWTIGVVVLILCFLERKHFATEIASKLGSSFSLVPFIVVVASCTFLAMIATLPLAQLFFFHILLIKKGISTYDYIIALREQEQEQGQDQEEQAAGTQQSPQMSQVSSFTGLSSASSFNAIHRGSWCTPPRLFLEDQFDVIPPEVGTSISHASKKIMKEEPTKRKPAGTIKINPWTLARLNAEEVSKAAAQARKKSKILQPIVRHDMLPSQDTDSSIGSGSGRVVLRSDNRKRINKRGRIPADLPLEPLTKISSSATESNDNNLATEASGSLAPLQLEARNAFWPNRAMQAARNVASSPDSSLDSPDLHPFRISSSGTEDVQGSTSLSIQGAASQKGILLSRSTSDGYEASGGEDSDRIPSRIIHRSSNWANIVLGSGHNMTIDDYKASSSADHLPYTRPQ